MYMYFVKDLSEDRVENHVMPVIDKNVDKEGGPTLEEILLLT